MKEDVLMQPGPVDQVRPESSASWIGRPWRVAWITLMGLLACVAAAWADDSLYRFGSFPKGLSTYAGEIDALHDVIFLITGLVFVLTEGLLLYFMWAYRARPGHKAIYSHGHMGLEVAWTLLPIAIFIFIGVYSVRLWNKIKDPSTFEKNVAERNLKFFDVRVVGQQFEWHIFYPGADGKLNTSDDIEVVNEMQVPRGEPIRVWLTAKDVIHSFFLPEMRVKQDAVPGMEVPIWFEATDFANLEIACAELCGLGHYRMKGLLKVVHKDALEKWLKEQEE